MGEHLADCLTEQAAVSDLYAVIFQHVLLDPGKQAGIHHLPVIDMAVRQKRCRILLQRRIPFYWQAAAGADAHLSVILMDIEPVTVYFVLEHVTLREPCDGAFVRQRGVLDGLCQLYVIDRDESGPCLVHSLCSDAESQIPSDDAGIPVLLLFAACAEELFHCRFRIRKPAA